MPGKQIGDTFHERVLIVEDDAAARVGMEQLIRSWGFSVEAASDGDEALERVTVFRPGIVLTDLVMPRMSGLELLRALREQGEHMATVILTAQGTVETAAEAIKQGAYEYLTKPVDLQRLRILLAKISQELRHGAPNGFSLRSSLSTRLVIRGARRLLLTMSSRRKPGTRACGPRFNMADN